jgi:RNA-binding protein 5/10
MNDITRHGKRGRSRSDSRDKERDIRGRRGDRERDPPYDGDRNRGRGTAGNNAYQESGPRSLVGDAENPGNQLLRKYGWSEGRGLGKDGGGIEDPVEARGRVAGSSTVGVGGDAGPVAVNPYGHGGGDYKESLMRAARARYDRLPDNR